MLLDRACFLKFRRRGLDQSENCVPRMYTYRVYVAGWVPAHVCLSEFACFAMDVLVGSLPPLHLRGVLQNKWCFCSTATFSRPRFTRTERSRSTVSHLEISRFFHPPSPKHQDTTARCLWPIKLKRRCNDQRIRGYALRTHIQVLRGSCIGRGFVK